MDDGTYALRWDDNPRGQNGSIMNEEIISEIDTAHLNMSSETIIPDTDQIAAENLIFLAQDIVGQIGNYVEPVQQFNNDSFTVEQDDIEQTGEIECQVTEEVITDDWVQLGGQERVEVPLDQLTLINIEQQNEGTDIDVPLPTDQDEYTAMRPYPCDFCSRRFRKKANLMNHMVAHQNDRPYGCNLCGSRYVRRSDLLNHLKVHAFVPEDGEEELVEEISPKRKGRKRSEYSISDKSSTYSDKTAVAARTQQYEGSGSGSAGISNLYTREKVIRYQVTDPSRPFVCQHCGVGFAREKALASHARVHGGDSPLECTLCGELCWSRENLISHTRSRHPNSTPQALPVYKEDTSSDESFVNDEEGDESWVELICKDCGAGFQRADLLQKHIRAAHNYLYSKKDSNNGNKNAMSDSNNDDNWGGQLNNACSQCGEHFKDALELLAHAESHARGLNNRCVSCGEKFTNSSMMAEHMSNAHPDLPSNICLFCGRMCSDEAALKKHISSLHNTAGKSLYCSKCGKNFRNKARLKRHMASHRDKSVTCDICGDNFADGRSLLNHRQTHRSNSGRQFPCHQCGKTFGSRSSQQIHIRIHTGERPYGCRFCWKAFADGGTLRKHERIHTGEKPYACAVCPRAFNQRVVLREHVRSHHSGPSTDHGKATMPFWCPVCDRLMATSSELISHIIQHCDNNTAMKRQPQVGPRKYKRRRKWNTNPQMSPTPLNKNASDLSGSDNELNTATVITPIKRGGRKRAAEKTLSFQPEENVVDVLPLNDTVVLAKSGESSVSGGGSARTKGKPKMKRLTDVIPQRPKMIHTERTKPPDSDSAVTRRKGRNILVVTTSTANIDEQQRVRPRTKNVSYHHDIERLPAATFGPSHVKAEPENDIVEDLRAILKGPVIEDVIEACTIIGEDEPCDNVKCEPSEDNNVDESFCVKEEMLYGGDFRCELCSESFGHREQLLVHVRIHI